jgi:hypothetical protein
VRDEEAARLSPLKAKKVNVLGRYAIVASQPAEGLRPLLNPANPATRTWPPEPEGCISGRLYHRPAPSALIAHGDVAVVTQRRLRW